MLAIVLAQPVVAQKQSAYNYQRAYELIVEQEDIDNGLKYLNQYLLDNPKDADGYYLRALTYNYKLEEYALALSDCSNAIKYVPSNDKGPLSLAYEMRASIYEKIEEYEKAESDYLTALKYNPKSTDLLMDIINMYLRREQYDKAEQYCLQLSKIDDSDVRAIVGLGVIARERDNDNNKAITYFDKAIKYSPSYTYAHSQRAQSLYNLKRYKEAFDEVIYVLTNSESGDEITNYLFVSILRDSPADVVRVMNQQIRDDKDNWAWYSGRGTAYLSLKEYDKAIKDYTKAEEILENNDAGQYKNIMYVYQAMGDYKTALQYINKAISVAVDKDIINDSPNLYVLRASINWGLGDIDKVIEDCSAAIEAYPTYAYAYTRRGRAYRALGQYNRALEDFNEALDIDEEDVTALLYRGRVLDKLGKKEQAKKDYEAIVSIDTAIYYISYKIYGLFHLGRTDEAIAWLNRILEKYPEEAAYEAACLYSLMNNKDSAIKYLEISFESGEQRDFYHVSMDDDLDNIRETAEYKNLISKYDNRNSFADVAGGLIDDNDYVEKTTVIKMKKAGGIFEIPCEINGLKLKGYFDSGASDISISLTEANFMLKNDYLKQSDILGKTSYLIANGDIAEGTVINLKEVKLGDFSLKNVKASVVHNQNAPILLGQTALKRFAKIEINNETSELKIVYKGK
jgi:clan AA aspartic protease (TIGR02281 family)